MSLFLFSSVISKMNQNQGVYNLIQFTSLSCKQKCHILDLNNDTIQTDTVMHVRPAMRENTASRTSKEDSVSRGCAVEISEMFEIHNNFFRWKSAI